MPFPRCALVFDVGSYQTRVGLSHDATPSTFPTLVPASSNANRKIRAMNLMVQNWDAMEKIYERGFEVAGAEPRSHPVVLNRSIARHQDEKIAQIFFEKFNVPGLHLNYSAVLALYSRGATTGLVVDSGFRETQFYPVYEGHILERAVTRGLIVGGDFLTEFLRRKLQDRNYFCTYETTNAIKEMMLYVSMDLEKEDARDESVVIDNHRITLSTERYLIPEELYAPRTIECNGLQEFILNVVYKCDPSLQHTFFKNIFVTGGTSLLPNFVPRLEKELKKSKTDYKSLKNCEPQITSLDHLTSVWLGGSKVAQLPTFPDMCMTLQEYEEHGPGLVGTKFF